MTIRKLIIIFFFIIAAYFAWRGETWLTFIFLVVGFLFIDYKSLNFLREGVEEFKKAEGSYPSGKLKSYTKNASKQTAEIMGKGYEGELGMSSGAGKKLSSGSKKFFDELKDLFK